MSTLLMKWAQNTQIKVNNSSKNHHHINSTFNGTGLGTAPKPPPIIATTTSSTGTSSNGSSTNGGGGAAPDQQHQQRKWIHPAEKLQQGHIAYLVKFLGNTVVEQAKGIDVVKEAIRKLRFSQQLRKSEVGTGSSAAKPRKVELTISIDGVAIQEPRTHIIQHQFPLHRISYCADDKNEKKFFSFIAKQPNQVDTEADEVHECFVFISDKRSEEITLTIGQAFELAYKRFLDTSGRDLETQRRSMIAQQRIQRLEQENNVYKKRLLEICQFKHIKPELDEYLRRHDIKNIMEMKQPQKKTNHTSDNNNGTVNGGGNLVDFNTCPDEKPPLPPPPTPTHLIVLNGDDRAPPIPPRTFDPMVPTVGTKLEGLLLNDDNDDYNNDDDDFDPRSFATTQNGGDSMAGGGGFSAPLIAPPPKTAKRITSHSHKDVFGSVPFGGSSMVASSILNGGNGKQPECGGGDPFEMGQFGGGGTTAMVPRGGAQEIENAIGLLDKRILEMKNGFSRGISFGNEDFSLESLDPLKH